MPWSDHSIDDAYSIHRSVLVGTVSQLGYTGEYYENRAYTCGRSGCQTFLIVYAEGLPLTTERPFMGAHARWWGGGRHLGQGTSEPPGDPGRFAAFDRKPLPRMVDHR